MEVKRIYFYGNNGWSHCIMYTLSTDLHVPRVGDFIKNEYDEEFRVRSVVWEIPANSIIINCDLIIDNYD